MEYLIKLLKSSSYERKVLIFEFENYLNSDISQEELSEQEYNILNELVFDLANYVANPEWRKEDPSYFGDEKLEELIKEALEKIEGLKKNN